jgi:hypothetical protein
MILCAAGDIHGAIDQLYADVTAFERALALEFDWILHVGDFGVWPDPGRVDGATRRHDGAGDFPLWVREQRPAPRKTLFIKANHEDFVWLDSQPTREVLPGLQSPERPVLRAPRAGVLRVGGIGGCYGLSNFDRPSRQLQGYAKRHYTRDEIDALAGCSGIDIVLTHDAPAGVRFERHRQGPGFVSAAAGLDELLAHTQPRVCFFGRHHTNLVAVEMTPGEERWRVLGESPRRG